MHFWFPLIIKKKLHCIVVQVYIMIKDFNSNCLGVIYNLLIGDMRAYIQYTYITTLHKIGLGANSVKITTLYLFFFLNTP